jgi:hypothetical protein
LRGLLKFLYDSRHVPGAETGKFTGGTMKNAKIRNLRTYFWGLVILLMSASLFAAGSIYDFTLNSIDGRPMPLADFKGKVILVAFSRHNTARLNPFTKSTKTKAS